MGTTTTLYTVSESRFLRMVLVVPPDTSSCATQQRLHQIKARGIESTISLEEGLHHLFFSVRLSCVEDLIALDISHRWIPANGQAADGRVDHLQVLHAPQWI